MQRSVAVSWRPSLSKGVFALSFPRSSLLTQHPVSSSSSTKTLWHPYTLTVLMSFSCCSLRLALTQKNHIKEAQHSSPVTVSTSAPPSVVWSVSVAEWSPSCVFGERPLAGADPRSTLCLRPRTRAWTSHAFSPFHQTLDLAFTPPFPWSLQWLPASTYDQ